MKVLNLTNLESVFLQTKLDQVGCDYLVTPTGIEVLNPSKALERLVEDCLILMVTQYLAK